MKKLLGHVSVDSGTLWIGDPCYVIGENSLQNRLKDWTDKLIENKYEPTEFEGLGIAVSTLSGDGIYPVYGNYNKEGELLSVTFKLS